MLKITVPADTIKALLMIAAEHDVRYYLNAVAVDHSATGTVLVVTDGHRLLAVPVLPEQLEVCDYGVTIIPRDTLKAVKCNPYTKAITITLDGDTITIEGATTATCKAVAGTFPNWRKVVPLTVDGQPAQYQGAYLGDFKKVNVLLGGKKDSSPFIHYNGAAPARVIFSNREAVGVIMPMRFDPQPLENPSWLVPPVATEAA